MKRAQSFRKSIVANLWAVALLITCGVPRCQETSLANPVAQQAFSTLSVTLERPLFAPSRHRPALPAQIVHAEPAPPPVPLAPPSVILVGTMTNDQDKYAMLRSGAADKILRVHIGDTVAGWKIVEIASRHVTFSLDERTSAVGLFQNQATKPPARNLRGGRGQSPDDDGIRGD